MKSNSKTVAAVGLSSILHLIGFYLLLSFFKPVMPESPENGISISFSETAVPLMRKLIHRRQVSFAPPSPTQRQSVVSTAFSQHPAMLPATTREADAFSMASEANAQWMQSLTSSPGEEIGTGSSINGEMRSGALPVAYTQNTLSPKSPPHRQACYRKKCTH